ncbi:MAG: O-antigen ligase family protein [Magnetococcales bacterium]|nr:O-antigen ligase family protein [Magnetococcales bacterium]
MAMPVRTDDDPEAAECCPLLFKLFLALVFLAPLPLGSNRPWAWGALEIGVFLLFGLGYWLAAQRERDDEAFATHYRMPALLWLLWSLYPLAQVLPLPEFLLGLLSRSTLELRVLTGWEDPAGPISLDRHATSQAWLKGMAYCGAFWLTLAWTTSYQRLKWLMLVVVGSGVFQALYGLMMVRNDPNWTVSGTYVNRNHLAGLLEMTIPMGIGLMIGWMKSRRGTDEEKPLLDWIAEWLRTASGRRGILSVVLVVMLLALFLTQSRAGNACLLLALVVVTFLSRLREGEFSLSREKRLMAPLLAISVVIGAWYGLGHLTGRLLQTTLHGEGRLMISLRSMEIVRDFYWFGSGAGTFGWIYPKYAGEESAVTFLDHAHNDHVEILVEQGVVGYGLLAGLLIYCWIFILQGYMRRRDPFMRGVTFGSLVATLALSLHALFDFNFQIPANALYFVVVLAMGMRAAVLPARRSSLSAYYASTVSRSARQGGTEG